MHVMWLQILTSAMNRAQVDTAPAMRRTDQKLCLSFVLEFCCPYLPCIIWRPACQKYSRALQAASSSVRYATSCTTKPSPGSWVQMCPLYQRVRYTSRHGLSSPKAIPPWNWMRQSKQQQVCFFYWTCKYFIVNRSGT